LWDFLFQLLLINILVTHPQFHLNLGRLHPFACVRSRWCGFLFRLFNVTIVC
jgi:hypothetical protein